MRTGHGTTDCFQIGKGVHQGSILSPCREHHAKCQLHEAQAEVKIARGNINNFRYADDTTLMAEHEEELRAS